MVDDCVIRVGLNLLVREWKPIWIIHFVVQLVQPHLLLVYEFLVYFVGHVVMDQTKHGSWRTGFLDFVV